MLADCDRERPGDTLLDDLLLSVVNIFAIYTVLLRGTSSRAGRKFARNCLLFNSRIEAQSGFRYTSGGTCCAI